VLLLKKLASRISMAERVTFYVVQVQRWGRLRAQAAP
jgi:hypothetical protein